MKKILALLCGLAFASGAWADNATYTFSLTITCPESFEKMSPSGAYYLVNEQTSQVYMYWMGSEWGSVTIGTSEMHAAGDVDHTAGKMTISGKEYQVVATHFDAGSQTVKNSAAATSGEKTVEFKHVFTANDADVFSRETAIEKAGITDDGFNKIASNLKVIVEDGVQGIYEVYQNVGFTGYVNNGGVYSAPSLTSSGYMSVPEPTSGLLLLLGVAGLALRRRKVA